MREKVSKLGIKRQKGYIYFIDDDGDVSKIDFKKYERSQNVIYKGIAEKGLSETIGGLEKAIIYITHVPMQKVGKLGIKQQKGYIYYIDEDGDVAREKLSKKARRYS